MLKLAIQGGKKSIGLDKDRIAVGRSDSNAVVLESRDVSRRHAEIVRTGDGVYLVDLGSTNGTRVNGKLLKKPRKLRAWDVVVFGSTRAEVVDTEGRRPGRILRALGVARAGSPRSPSAVGVPQAAPAWVWAAGGAIFAVGLIALFSLARNEPDGQTPGGSPPPGPEETPVAAGGGIVEVGAAVEGVAASRVAGGTGGTDDAGATEEPVGAAASSLSDPPNDNLAGARRWPEEFAAAEAAGRPRQSAEAARVEVERRRIASLEDLCHEDLKSIVVDTTSLDLAAEKGLYYDHIYQYVEEYPYWKYVGGGLIGIAYRKNVRSGNREIEGNTDAEGDNHVSLRLSGTGNLDGIPLTIDMTDGTFGYLMVPDTAEDRHASFLDIGRIRALTTMAGEIVEIPRRNLNGDSYSFYRVTPRRENPIGTALMRRSPRDRWLGIRRTYWEGGETVYERPETENLWLRTINASEERAVEIAGRERRQRVLCRYEYGPVAVTNDERLRPEIERELNAWADRYRAATEAKARAEEVVRFAEVPRELDGEFRVRGRCGSTELRFPTRSSAIRIDRTYLGSVAFRKRYNGGFYVDGDLIVNGTEFPDSARATLGAWFQHYTARQAEEFRESAMVVDQLRDREFEKVEWTNDDIGIDCDWTPEGQAPNPDTCWLRAQRQVLEKAGCDP